MWRAVREAGLSPVCSWQEDYRRTVTEIDEKEYISLRLIISELRNQYVSESTEFTLPPQAAVESPWDPAAPLSFPPEFSHSWHEAYLLPTWAPARQANCCFSTIS